jgi:hypothetical protein
MMSGGAEHLASQHLVADRVAAAQAAQLVEPVCRLVCHHEGSRSLVALDEAFVA